MESLTVTPGKPPVERPQASAFPDRPGDHPGDDPGDDSVSIDTVGLTLAGLTYDVRQLYGIGRNDGGAAVVDVRPGSPAAARGIRPGDVILAVGRTRVESPDQVAAEVRRARTAGQRSGLLLVARRGSQRYVALPLGVA